MKSPVCIDISHYDEVTSFKLVKEAGIRLCVCKATQGITSKDSAYEGFIQRCETVGLLHGSYHFGTNFDGILQAKWFLSNTKLNSLLVLDLERYPKSQMSICQAEAFVKYIYDTKGIYVLLYFGEWFKEQVAKGLVSKDSILWKCPGWLAEYNSTYHLKMPLMNLVLWQYSGDGVGDNPHGVNGIIGNAVDMSEWLGGPITNIPLHVKKHSIRA